MKLKVNRPVLVTALAASATGSWAAVHRHPPSQSRDPKAPTSPTHVNHLRAYLAQQQLTQRKQPTRHASADSHKTQQPDCYIKMCSVRLLE